MSLILSGNDYLALPRLPETFLVDPLLPVGGALTIYGDPKVGKSYAAIQLATSIVGGGEWLGFPIRKRGSVAYIQLDTPRSLWAERLDQLAQGGIDIASVHFGDRESLGTWPFNILEPKHFEVLTTALTQMDPFPVAVIIDTLKESHQLDENDATEAQKVIAALTAATQPAALILIHHGRKQGEVPDDLLVGSRGSSYLMGKMDAIVKMNKKSVHYVGRAIEEWSIRLDRLDNGFWAPSTDEMDRLIEGILASPGTTSDRARTLATQTHRSEEAARSLIRRYQTRRA